MHHIWAPLLVLFLLPSLAAANAGIFFGSGHTISLGKSERVQLVSEEVVITPRGGWVPEADAVEYRCAFTLRNLTDNPVTVQVGFPINSQFIEGPKPQSDVTKMVLDYHFVAREDEKTYHLRYVAHDREKKFSTLFVWDMTFDPRETKTLHVAYQMPMSRALLETNSDKLTPKALKRHRERPWHVTLETSMVAYFHYVTETGKSWAGDIERATFRVEMAQWEQCLARRPFAAVDGIMSSRDDTEEDEYDMLPDDVPRHFSSMFHAKAWAVFRHIEPNEGKREDDGAMTWTYQPYEAGKSFGFYYWSLPLPSKADDCDEWVKHVLGSKPSKSNLAELREIMAGFYGVTPQSTFAKGFLEQQNWYHPKKRLEESKLPENQAAVLQRLDEIARVQGH
jgi:hypothetical protein